MVMPLVDGDGGLRSLQEDAAVAVEGFRYVGVIVGLYTGIFYELFFISN